MKQLETIKFLLAEMEQEIIYNAKHEKEVSAAQRKAEERGVESWRYPWGYGQYMPEDCSREPRQSVIQQNAKTIRRLLLGYYKKKGV